MPTYSFNFSHAQPELVRERSEVKLQGKLKLALHAARAQDLPKGGIRKVPVWDPPRGYIRCIESFKSKFQPLGFRYGKLPEERKIEILEPISPQGVASKSSKRERDRNCKGRSIEPFCCCGVR